MNIFFSFFLQLFLKCLILQAFEMYGKTYNVEEIYLIISDSVYFTYQFGSMRIHKVTYK
jgi:hypothetical protein